MGVRPKATTRRMLNLIGLGLHDEKDITVNGLAAVRRSERVYLEAYTSILGVPKDRLDAFYGKECIVADRDMVETMSDEILQDADKLDVSFLVVGDPFGATTHSDLLLRADERGVPVRVFHNASVMNAAGAAGLALYNYGQAVSVPFFTDSWRPSSWVPRILENSRLGLHTLCLLDIKVKEQSEENLARGRKIYEPPRYMSVPTALEQLLSVLPEVEQDMEGVPAAARLSADDTLAISLSRVGQPSQLFRAGTLAELAALTDNDFGPPLHSIVIVGSRLHALERDMGAKWAVPGSKWREVAERVYECRD